MERTCCQLLSVAPTDARNAICPLASAKSWPTCIGGRRADFFAPLPMASPVRASGNREANASATTVCHEMATLPFPDGLFDGLLSYNVIYHATVAGMRRILAEIRRVLRPDGRLYVTIIARKDSRVSDYRADMATGKCREIEPFTFIYPRDAPGDKYLPHHYSDEAELDVFLAGFSVDDLCLVHIEYTDEDGLVQTGAHYHVQARRI